MQALSNFNPLGASDFAALGTNAQAIGTGLFLGGLITFAVNRIATAIFCPRGEASTGAKVAIAQISSIVGFTATAVFAPQATLIALTAGKILQLAAVTAFAAVATIWMAPNDPVITIATVAIPVIAVVGGFFGSIGTLVAGGIAATGMSIYCSDSN